ncbi:hypothetical protein TNCV_4763361 [Trichonephila clavipes]|nr:hypothetical protein TNCV_4763361 [Trichonephila clavipes]
MSRRPENHNVSTTSLDPRFDTVGLMVVNKIERVVERSTFFNECRSSGSTQIDANPTEIYLHGQNEKRDKRFNECVAVSVDYVEK